MVKENGEKKQNMLKSHWTNPTGCGWCVAVLITHSLADFTLYKTEYKWRLSNTLSLLFRANLGTILPQRSLMCRGGSKAWGNYIFILKIQASSSKGNKWLSGVPLRHGLQKQNKYQANFLFCFIYGQAKIQLLYLRAKNKILGGIILYLLPNF